jgi:hypothetical protein
MDNTINGQVNSFKLLPPLSNRVAAGSVESGACCVLPVVVGAMGFSLF